MLPSAPPTFSMMTGCPSDALIRSATSRPIKSVALPAAADTIMVMGRMGYACALAIRDTAGSTAAAAVRLDGEVSLRAPEAHSDLRLAARITLPHFSVS